MIGKSELLYGPCLYCDSKEHITLRHNPMVEKAVVAALDDPNFQLAVFMNFVDRISKLLNQVNPA
jgi:hypothetical protein